MKAAIIKQFGGPEVFSIEEVPKPEPGPRQVLIRVHASSINPVDWKMRTGSHKKLLGAPFPIILGFDAAGTVDAVGDKATQYKPGDRVYGRLDVKYGGALAEYALGSEKVFASIPDELDFITAAAIPMAAQTALQALRDKGRIREGQKVLVNGASGGGGHMALQIAELHGAEVTAVCSAGHREMMETLRPHHWVDYQKTPVPTLEKKYDLFFDAVGTESFLTVKHLLTGNGVYITTLPRLKLLAHKLVALFHPFRKVRTLLQKSRGSELKLINLWIEEGMFRVWIDDVYTLDEIVEAHRYASEYKADGKIVVEIK